MDTPLFLSYNYKVISIDFNFQWHVIPLKKGIQARILT